MIGASLIEAENAASIRLHERLGFPTYIIGQHQLHIFLQLQVDLDSFVNV